MSFVDGGLTFGTNRDAGSASTYRARFTSPMRRSGHSALTVTVADLEGLAAALGPRGRSGRSGCGVTPIVRPGSTRLAGRRTPVRCCRVAERESPAIGGVHHPTVLDAQLVSLDSHCSRSARLPHANATWSRPGWRSSKDPNRAIGESGGGRAKSGHPAARRRGGRDPCLRRYGRAPDEALVPWTTPLHVRDCQSHMGDAGEFGHHDLLTALARHDSARCPAADWGSRTISRRCTRDAHLGTPKCVAKAAAVSGLRPLRTLEVLKSQ